jgi:serine/threonine-protein kinase HipA
MKKIDQLLVRYHATEVGTLSLTPDNRLCAFQYAPSWLAHGFSLSPLELPLRAGLFVAQPQPFAGDFGVFEDCLPDGYGRYLMHKALLREGVDDSRLSALDRLSLVGGSGMGALTFEPATPLQADLATTDFDLLQAKALEVLSEKSDDDAGLLLFNSANSGGCRPKALFSDADGHWLIKFRHTYDPLNMGEQEYRYNEVARQCGICVPDFKLTRGRYFTVRRFDRTTDGQRRHVVTAGGLLCLSLSNPVLDYSNLLALTGYLTQNPADVEELYRRMVFNYVTENRDDHCKNFSYYVEADAAGVWRWHLAPAYDLTHCTEGYNGEHATSVNGTGRPTLSDFLAVGAKVRLSAARCRALIEQVSDACGALRLYTIPNQ